MDLEKVFDNLHSRTIRNLWLQRFTIFTRIILAVGFIPPSLKKIFSQPFTVLPDSNPVGHYFNALYPTGFYYQFIGWAQLVAAILFRLFIYFYKDLWGVRQKNAFPQCFPPKTTRFNREKISPAK